VKNSAKFWWNFNRAQSAKVPLLLTAIGVVIMLVCSCVSKPYMPLSDVPNAQVLETLEVMFETSYVEKDVDPNSPENQMAYQSGQNLAEGGFKAAFSGGQAGAGQAQAGLIGGGIALGVAAIKDIDKAVTKKKINEAAHAALLEEAMKRYTGNIDVRDVTFSLIQYNYETGLYKYNANGTVVSFDELFDELFDESINESFDE